MLPVSTDAYNTILKNTCLMTLLQNTGDISRIVAKSLTAYTMKLWKRLIGIFSKWWSFTFNRFCRVSLPPVQTSTSKYDLKFSPYLNPLLLQNFSHNYGSKYIYYFYWWKFISAQVRPCISAILWKCKQPPANVCERDCNTWKNFLLLKLKENFITFVIKILH